MLNYETLLGTMNLHQVWSILHKDPTLLQTWDCPTFAWLVLIGALKEQCDSKCHVTPWSFWTLKPSNSLEVCKNTYDHTKEIDYGNGGESIANVVLVGDNIVIKADKSTNEDFWLMLVDKCVYVVEEDFRDAWENSYLQGENVPRGLGFMCLDMTSL